MASLLLALLLSAHPTPDEASALAAKKDWPGLFLAFSQADAGGYGDAERTAIGARLRQGCQGLRGEDDVLAMNISELAFAFHPTAEAAICMANSAVASGQVGLVLPTLREAMRSLKGNGALALAVGKALIADHERKEAVAVLSDVPRSHPAYGEARQLASKLSRELSAEEDDLLDAQRREAQAAAGSTGSVPAVGQRGAGGRAGPQAATEPANTSRSYATEGGMRARTHKAFVIRYFGSGRDFSQRAEYEGRVTAALDAAAVHTRGVLGFAREQPLDVVLYTREEFALHMGARAARSIAGLYSMDAIRINDAAKLTRQTHATLTHEYVHAVVDEVAGNRSRAVPIWFNEGLAEYVEWKFLGSDLPPFGARTAMRGAAAAGRLPKLADLARGALIATDDPQMAYSVSGLAVRRLMQVGGGRGIRKLIEDVAGGKTFEGAMKSRFGMSVEELDAKVATDAASR